MIHVFLLAALLAAPAAQAATITAGASAGGGWTPADVAVERLGRCGSGGVVTGDGCRPVSAETLAPGREFGQDMRGGINSQDSDSLRATVSSLEKFDRIWIETRDAHDQPRSRWSMSVNGETVSLPTRQADGARNSWVVDLRRKVGRAAIRFQTALNDGFSFKAKVCRR